MFLGISGRKLLVRIKQDVEKNGVVRWGNGIPTEPPFFSDSVEIALGLESWVERFTNEMKRIGLNVSEPKFFKVEDIAMCAVEISR